MPIVVFCSGCRMPMTLGDDASGSKVVCAHCRVVADVPAIGPAPQQDQMIRFACPSCSKSLKSPLGTEGRVGRCKCGASFTVPHLEVVTTPVAARPVEIDYRPELAVPAAPVSVSRRKNRSRRRRMPREEMNDESEADKTTRYVVTGVLGFFGLKLLLALLSGIITITILSLIFLIKLTSIAEKF